MKRREPIRLRLYSRSGCHLCDQMRREVDELLADRPREWEVVELLLRSASTSEIASQLGVAPVTVRRHVGSVERKLGVSTRAEVVALLTGESK